MRKKMCHPLSTSFETYPRIREHPWSCRCVQIIAKIQKILQRGASQVPVNALDFEWAVRVQNVSSMAKRIEIVGLCTRTTCLWRKGWHNVRGASRELLYVLIAEKISASPPPKPIPKSTSDALVLVAHIAKVVKLCIEQRHLSGSNISRY